MSQSFTKNVLLDTDPTLAGNSDYIAPSQSAVKGALDAKAHNSLSGLDVGDYQHLTAAQATLVSKLGDGITAGKTLTLTATNNFNLTVPATGTAALLSTANIFTDNQTLGGTNDPKLILNEGNTGTSLFEIADTSAATAVIKKTSASGVSLIDIDPIPADGTSNSSFRFWRSTTTTGQYAVSFHQGGATVQAQISAKSNAFTFFSLDHNFGIGTNSPGGKLDVTQESSTGAKAVIDLEQLDVSEEYFNFISAATTAGNPIDTATAVGTAYARARVAVNGTFKYIQLYNA